jgi:hypothetical protein
MSDRRPPTVVEVLVAVLVLVAVAVLVWVALGIASSPVDAVR